MLQLSKCFRVREVSNDQIDEGDEDSIRFCTFREVSESDCI